MVFPVKDVHLGMYENRPIYFPLSSTKKNFVALVSIHYWADDTLQTLLADYLLPELTVRLLQLWHLERVKKLIEAEEKRRDRKRRKEDIDDYGPLFEEEGL